MPFLWGGFLGVLCGVFFWMLQKAPICNYAFLCKVQSLISKYLLNHTVSKICRLPIISEDVQFISFIFRDFTSENKNQDDALLRFYFPLLILPSLSQ